MKYLAPLSLLFVASPSFSEEVLLPVEVKEKSSELQNDARSTDVTSLLNMTPGAHVRGNGGIANQPSLNGLSNDRVNVRIDDVVITSSCSNHMNSPLSYVDTFKVDTLDVYAGLSPVSAGGDSLGSSILVKTPSPVFSDSDEIHKKLSLSTFYKSNNFNSGAALNAEVASSLYSFQYLGTDEKAGRYKTGGDKRLKGTIFNQNNQILKVARKLESGVVDLKFTRAKVPFQGFVNQYMDMNDNSSDAVQLSYDGEINGYLIEATASHQQTDHYMNKLTSERSGNMPMNTLSDETNANVKVTKDLTSRHTLKTGAEYQRYRLQDWWRPVPGAMMMSPNTFKSIHQGQRDRVGLFGEVNSKITNKFSLLTGLRADIVDMDTGDVEGYNNTNNSPADEAAFNQKKRNKRDHNWDAILSGRYAFSEETHLDFGYTRKSRSPNLYERYAWAGSTTSPGTPTGIQMDMRMINWFGDGNGYTGDIGLKPEVAHTFQTELKHSDEKWGGSFTPYFTYVEDYIDADLLYVNPTTRARYLRFANHDAVLFGANASATVKLLRNFNLSLLTSYVRGYRVDKKSDLYHLMPVNGKIRLEHVTDKFNTKFDVVLVNKKTTVSKLRDEPEIAGYALLDISTAYQVAKWVKVELAVLNLLDKEYSQPLGGVDVVNFTVASKTPVIGMGRSINTLVKFEF